MRKIGSILLFIFLTGLFTGLFFSTCLSTKNTEALSALLLTGITTSKTGFLQSFLTSLLTNFMLFFLMLPASSSYPAAEPLPDPRLFPVRPGSPILLSAKFPPPIRCRQALCRKLRAPYSFRRPPQCSCRIFPCKKQPAHKGQTASITDYFFLASGRRIPYGSSSSPSCSFAIIRAAMVFASIISPRAAI